MEHIGGQAVIEGVMMRNKDKTAVATIKNNRIKTKKLRFNSVTKKHKWLKWPFFRGVVGLIEMLVLGIKALIYSANEAEDEPEEKLGSKEIFFTMLLAILFTIGIFIVLPYFLTGLISKDKGMLFNLIDGILRIVIFLIYIIIISSMKDIRRVFQYHGAEHKAVNCYEHKKKLTVENCGRFTTVHRRCGTTFLIIVLVVSILVFSMIVSDKWHWRIGLRVLLIPVITGISYELLKLGAKHENNMALKLLTYPGLLLQKLTTREPTKKQIKVAIKALKAVL